MKTLTSPAGSEVGAGAVRGRRRRRSWPIWMIAVIVVALVLVLIWWRQTDGAEDAPPAAVAVDGRTQQAVERFFDGYVQPDGRVARSDQGDDTVSEGQAYAMLMAAAVGDRARFDLVWDWTRTNLQQPSGLLAWHWAGGEVADTGSASDADLFAAAALALAAERFGSEGLLIEARAMSDAILSMETVAFGADRVLAAGPWATDKLLFNPSYWAVAPMAELSRALGDNRWDHLAAVSRSMTNSLTSTWPNLPPDWAVGTSPGKMAPRHSPDGQSARYGADAVRIPIQFAVDCDPGGQELAARSWTFLASRVGPTNSPTLPWLYSLDGQPMTDTTSAPALVAAASAAGAAGDRDAAAGLLDAASEHDRSYPTYYGAALVALGRLWMQTDLAGGCRPGSPVR